MSGWSVRRINHAMPRVTGHSKFKRTNNWMQAIRLQISNKRTTCLIWAWIWMGSWPRSYSQATSWKISQPKIWLLKTSAVTCSITSIKKWIKLEQEGKAKTIITKIWIVLITTNLATSSISNSQLSTICKTILTVMAYRLTSLNCTATRSLFKIFKSNKSRITIWKMQAKTAHGK